MANRRRLLNGIDFLAVKQRLADHGHGRAAGGHCHHCDAAVETNQIAIRKKRASLGQDGNGRLV